MSTKICPECGCYVGVDAYEADGVTYCCEACSSGGECDCGCCAPVQKDRQEDKAAAKKEG